MSTAALIQESILVAILPTGTATWSQIAASVEASTPIRKNGWMKVRSLLQGLVDRGLIARTSDVRAETYVLTVRA